MMRRMSILALLAWLCCSHAGSAPAPARPDSELPKGITQVALPEGSVTFETVRSAEGWLVKVQAKGVTLTAARLFLRDKDTVIEIIAEKGELKFTVPRGTSSYFGDKFVWGKGTFTVSPVPEGGRDRIRAGDVILTHPQIRIEVGEVCHLELRAGVENRK